MKITPSEISQTKGQTLCNFTYVRVLTAPNSETESRMVVASGRVLGELSFNTELQFCKTKQVLEMDGGVNTVIATEL